MIPEAPRGDAAIAKGGMTRRQALGTLALAAAGALPAGRAVAQAPGPSLREALALRRSSRRFAARPVEPGLRAELLWAAGGVNRPDSGGRTAPSWHGALDATLRLAEAAGTGLYDPGADAVRPLGSDDVRGRLSPQPFVATAPLVLVHVSDLGRLRAAAPGAAAEDLRIAAHVDAAVAAQNVYLACAALGLGTCLVGGIDRDGVAAAFALGPDDLPTYVQPVGWPA